MPVEKQSPAPRVVEVSLERLFLNELVLRARAAMAAAP